MGYSDKYNKSNEFMYRRNLSFNSNIWELALQGDFNFLKFIPGSAYNRFTPYITFGVGVFNYDPYAYYQGQKSICASWDGGSGLFPVSGPETLRIDGGLLSAGGRRQIQP
ncbi:DUF6089 family protein [Puia sp. P3]|uniref:DUF6089 family protein n=1 Tax=Puia sp. P3 TaxID=3423952 RepID=UPI003D66EA0B